MALERDLEGCLQVPVLSQHPTPPMGTISHTQAQVELLFLQHHLGEYTNLVLQILVIPPCQAQVQQQGLLAAPLRVLRCALFLEKLEADSQMAIELFGFGMVANLPLRGFSRRHPSGRLLCQGLRRRSCRAKGRRAACSPLPTCVTPLICFYQICCWPCPARLSSAGGGGSVQRWDIHSEYISGRVSS